MPEPANPPSPVRDRREALESIRIHAHFQPWVSVKRKAVIGFEALARGLDRHGNPVPPAAMFAQAKAQGAAMELDRRCRQAALEAFAPVHAQDRRLILSINIEPSVIEAALGSGHLRDAVAGSGINPNNVSIELVESHSSSLNALERFTRTYQDLGFLITVDDAGVGHSNLDRVAFLKPDIIKIDRSLVTDIDRRYHQQEIVKSLVGLSHRIGALPIAEGIETEEEAVALLLLGIDVMQGYYFCRPHALDDLSLAACHDRIEIVSKGFRIQAAARMRAKRERWRMYGELVARIADDLAALTPEGYDRFLENTVTAIPALECAYVLDRAGRQASKTHTRSCRLSTHRKIIFQPADKGADHSLKDYYLPISEETRTFITEPYISFATGNLCQTIAALVEHSHGAWSILCLDLAVESTA